MKIFPSAVAAAVTVVITALPGCSTLGSRGPTPDTAARQAAVEAAIASGIGQLPPEEVSGYLDALEAKLREDLEGTGLTVARSAQEIRLSLPFHLTFMADKINRMFVPAITSAAGALEQYDKTLVEVSGVSADAEEAELAGERAALVARLLVENLGIAPERVWTAEAGVHRAIAGDAGPGEQLASRRVELVVVPLSP